MTGLSTLCYIEKDGKYLMLHRTVKKNDVNKDIYSVTPPPDTKVTIPRY